MSRTKKMFFAFTGKDTEQEDKIFEIQDGYECWNLRKMKLEEFDEEIKIKIPPVNKNALRNYKLEDESKGIANFGITENRYKKASWGLLIPDTLEEGGFSFSETMFLLNLYSPKFLYPLFYVNDMGINRQEFDRDPFIYFHTQDYSIFNKKKFVSFYKTIFEQSQYRGWYYHHINEWNKEDYRLFIAANLFEGLKDYENSKDIFGWQRESAEMATILETLFTAGDSRTEEVGYRLRKRIAVLLHWKFSNIEKELKKLYIDRSDFVHGSFFLQIAKDSLTASNNIPVPDFDLLYRQKEYVRHALVAYLYLALLIKRNNAESKDGKTVMSTIEDSIIDTELREKLIKDVQTLFALMPISVSGNIPDKKVGDLPECSR